MLRVVFEAGIGQRLRPDHRRARLNQLAEFLRHRRGHFGRVRQNQHAVAHAIGQHDFAVFHRESREQHLLVADIVVVALAEAGGDMLRADEIRRAVAIVIKHIGGEEAALQERMQRLM